MAEETKDTKDTNKETPKKTTRRRGGTRRGTRTKRKTADAAEAPAPVEPGQKEATAEQSGDSKKTLSPTLVLENGDHEEKPAAAEKVAERKDASSKSDDPKAKADTSEDKRQEPKTEADQPRKRRRGRRRSRRPRGDDSFGNNIHDKKQDGDKQASGKETEPVAKEAPGKDDKQADANKAAEGEGEKKGGRRRRRRSKPIEKVAAGDVHMRKDEGRVLLINVDEDEECRIAIMHQNRLEELFIERASSVSHVGNIYKGRVTNVEPSIQAAFIDFGLPKNGFLHISDLQPQYFPDHRGHSEEVGKKTPRRERPPIQRCLRRGQEVIVQIIKEGIGTKGPTLTTYISIPGRYLVMMPGMNKLGVSRRIDDEDARRKMRKVLEEMKLPREMGFILRTAGMDRTKRDLQRDYTYLQRLWKVVVDRIKNERAPCELYQESDLVIRTIRDVYSSDFSRIVVDDEQVAQKVREFLSIAMPRTNVDIQVYSAPTPLFHKFGLEKEIERINARHVPLPSGGSLVIDSTEALVAIDVNSGKYREHEDAEQTAYRINMEAAEEIARQLRLRDLGGLILCDFIDMHQEKHRRAVERAMRESLKKHKERAKCLRMSQFGIMEMTRQRMRPSIKRSIFQDCPHCSGSGLVKNAESMTLDIMRLLRLALHHDQVSAVEVWVAPDVAFQLQNRKRAAIYKLEERTGRRVIVRSDHAFSPDQYVFECFDHRGGTVRVIDVPETARRPGDNRLPHRPHPQLSEPRVEPRDILEDVFD